MQGTYTLTQNEMLLPIAGGQQPHTEQGCTAQLAAGSAGGAVSVQAHRHPLRQAGGVRVPHRPLAGAGLQQALPCQQMNKGSSQLQPKAYASPHPTRVWVCGGQGLSRQALAPSSQTQATLAPNLEAPGTAASRFCRSLGRCWSLERGGPPAPWPAPACDPAVAWLAGV